MEQQLTIEQLKKAREIGATHWDFNYRQFRKDGYIYSNDCVWRIGVCKRYFADYSDIIEIDFTPLDEYYADKDADIRATGGDDIPAILNPQMGAVDYDTHCAEAKPIDGHYWDDEAGKHKPLKPANKGYLKQNEGELIGALAALVSAYRNLGGLDCSHDKELTDAERLLSSSKPSAQYEKYFRDFSDVDYVDVYLVHQKFGIEDKSGALHHASKKILLSGTRTGGKSKYQDIKEARDTLNRWLEINTEKQQ